MLHSNPYVISLGIIIGSIILSLLTRRILKVASVFTAKTRTKLDNFIIEHIKRPIQLLILTLGLFFAIKYVGWEITLGQISLIQIFTSFWIFAVAYLVARIIQAFFTWYTEDLQHKLKRKVDRTLFTFLRKVINFSIYLIALGAILKQFGIEITPLLAGLGIAGIGIALALKDTLSNLFSALYITIDRPMRLGDYIELDTNTAGYVKNIGWRTTRLKTWDNNHVIMPNSKIAEAIFKNYDAPRKEMTVRVACGVSYDSNLEKVEKVAIEEAKKIQKKVEGAVDDYEPVLRFREFADSAITFTVNLKVKNRESRGKVIHKYIKALHKRFNKEKIEIPFPQRDIHMKK